MDVYHYYSSLPIKHSLTLKCGVTLEYICLAYQYGLHIWLHMVTLVYNIWLHLYYFGPSVFCFVISTPPLSEMYFDVAFLHRTFNGCWGNSTAFGEILQNQIQTRCLQKVAVKTFPLHDGPHGFHLLARASSSRLSVSPFPAPLPGP